MINVTDLARRLSTVVGRSTGAEQHGALRLTPEIVRAYMAPRSAALAIDHGPRAGEEIDRLLATLPRLVAEERLARRHPGFVRYFEALPRIVFMTGRGYSSEEISNQMNFLATEYGIETVLNIVAVMIARRLTRG